MNRCLEMNPMPANHVVPWTSSCKRKAKIRWYCKKNQNKIHHQSSVACSSKKLFFSVWFFRFKNDSFCAVNLSQPIAWGIYSPLKQSRMGHLYLFLSLVLQSGRTMSEGTLEFVHHDQMVSFPNISKLPGSAKGSDDFAKLDRQQSGVFTLPEPPVFVGSSSYHFISSSWRTSTTSLECWRTFQDHCNRMRSAASVALAA